MSAHTAYRLVEAHYVHQLQIEVNEAIGKGWQCIGGVAVLANGWFMQSMVKPAETSLTFDNHVVTEGDTVKLVRDGGGA